MPDDGPPEGSGLRELAAQIGPVHDERQAAQQRQAPAQQRLPELPSEAKQESLIEDAGRPEAPGVEAPRVNVNELCGRPVENDELGELIHDQDGDGYP